MWIMTEYGFLSAVAHRNDKNAIMIRSRNRDDLMTFCDIHGHSHADIVSTPDADYPVRITITRRQFAEAIAADAINIEYDNFKNQVKRICGVKRANVYMSVWCALQGLHSKATEAYRKSRWKVWQDGNETVYEDRVAWGSEEDWQKYEDDLARDAALANHDE